MRFSNFRLWLAAMLLPLAFAVAQTPAASDSSQRTASEPGAMAGGHMMGNRTMTFNTHVQQLMTQLQENLSGLETESNVDVLHARIAEAQTLFGKLKNTLDGHCGMSMGSMGTHMHSGQMMHGRNGNMMGGHMMGGHQMMTSQTPGQDGSSAPQDPSRK